MTNAAHAKPFGSDTRRIQAPGYYRHAVGDYMVTAVYDGTVALDPIYFTGVTDENKAQALRRQLLAASGEIDTSVNAFIVDTGAHIILIDAGSAHTAGPTMGRMLANIEAAGYSTEDIDTVLITHMHLDHIGGISNEQGERFFPNATVWASKADADFWLDSATNDKLPAKQGEFVRIAQEAVAPYVAIDRFKTFVEGDDVAYGLVTIEPSPGHTPGHTGFSIESNGEKMLFWGDIAHLPSIQLPHPSATIDLDILPELAVSSRERVLAEAAESGRWVAAAHTPFPGIGRVVNDADGYAWVAVEYGAIGALVD